MKAYIQHSEDTLKYLQIPNNAFWTGSYEWSCEEEAYNDVTAKHEHGKFSLFILTLIVKFGYLKKSFLFKKKMKIFVQEKLG